MSKLTRIGATVAVAGAAMGILGGGIASAAPPVATPEPGGVIRLDVAPGEWWACQGLSLAPPFFQIAPGFYQYVQGPNPIFLRFAPGADVWIECSGSGAPFIYYGPVVTAGQ